MQALLINRFSSYADRIVGDGVDPAPNRRRPFSSFNALVVSYSVIPGLSANLPKSDNVRIARQPPRTPKSGNFSQCSLSSLAISHHLTQLLCPIFQCLDRKRQKHTVDGIRMRSL